MLTALLDASRADPQQVGAHPDVYEAPAPRDVSHFAGLRLNAADIDTGSLPPRCPARRWRGS